MYKCRKNKFVAKAYQKKSELIVNNLAITLYQRLMHIGYIFTTYSKTNIQQLPT